MIRIRIARCASYRSKRGKACARTVALRARLSPSLVIYPCLHQIYYRARACLTVSTLAVCRKSGTPLVRTPAISVPVFLQTARHDLCLYKVTQGDTRRCSSLSLDVALCRTLLSLRVLCVAGGQSTRLKTSMESTPKPSCKFPKAPCVNTGLPGSTSEPEDAQRLVQSVAALFGFGQRHCQCPLYHPDAGLGLLGLWLFTKTGQIQGEPLLDTILNWC
jgi:hypothetical protein